MSNTDMIPKALIRQIARENNLSEAETEYALRQLIEQGHLRIILGPAAHNRARLEFVLKGQMP